MLEYWNTTYKYCLGHKTLWFTISGYFIGISLQDQNMNMNSYLDI